MELVDERGAGEAMLTVQNRVEVHRKRTSDLVPFSPKRVLQGLLIQGLEANR
jgi:hypothetical protein